MTDLYEKTAMGPLKIKLKAIEDHQKSISDKKHDN